VAGHRWRGDPSVQGSAEGYRRYVIEFLAPPLVCLCVRSGCGRIGLTATAARKALQESVQEDEVEEDEDEQRYLNLNEEEGDVWDDDSAYIEMLAKEVRARLLLPSSVGMW
jgi:hypothetical protein